MSILICDFFMINFLISLLKKILETKKTAKTRRLPKAIRAKATNFAEKRETTI